MNKFLEHLLSAEVIYYLYNCSDSIFGLEYKDRYIVVCDEKYKIPKEFRKYKVGTNHSAFKLIVNDVEFTIYTLQQWFQKIEQCHIEPWICACLNKKYVLKEYVKLLMKTEPLKLRLLFDNIVIPTQNLEKTKYYCWKQFRDLKFINQIIFNHKIMNFKEIPDSYVQSIYEQEDIKSLLKIHSDLIIQDKIYLGHATDGILLKYKQEKLRKKHEENNSTSRTSS